MHREVLRLSVISHLKVRLHNLGHDVAIRHQLHTECLVPRVEDLLSLRLERIA